MKKYQRLFVFALVCACLTAYSGCATGAFQAWNDLIPGSESEQSAQNNREQKDRDAYQAMQDAQANEMRQQIAENDASNAEAERRSQQKHLAEQAAEDAPRLAAPKEEDFEIEQLADNTIKIKQYKGKSQEMVIPETLYGLKVTVIGKESFTSLRDEVGRWSDDGKNRIFVFQGRFTRIVIPDTVTRIEDGALKEESISMSERRGGRKKQFQALTALTIGKNVTYIGKEAFAGHVLLENVTLPDSLNFIGENAFINCGLTDVTLPNNPALTISAGAFNNNKFTKLPAFPAAIKGVRRWLDYNQIAEITVPGAIEYLVLEGNPVTTLTIPPSHAQIKMGKAVSIKGLSAQVQNGFNMTSEQADDLAKYLDERLYDSLTAKDKQLVDKLDRDTYRSRRDPSQRSTAFIDIMSHGVFIKCENTLTRVTLPANVSEEITAGFGAAFNTFWKNQGKKAGTYVKRGPVWTME